MTGGDVFDGVGFVKDDEVIGEKITDFLEVFFGLPADEAEKEGMIDDDRRGENGLLAGSLIKTTRIVSAGAWGAEMGFAADLRPDFRIRGEFEIGKGAVLGGEMPVPDSFELGDFAGDKEISGMSHRAFESSRAEIVLASFHENDRNLFIEEFSDQRKIFEKELFLKIDRVGGEDCFALMRFCVEQGGNQIGEAFPNAGSCFNQKM